MKAKNTIWMIALIFIATAVSAGLYNPETYWGYVYVEGDLAPAGAYLTVESQSTGELFVNQTLPFNSSFAGSYSIMIEFDDEATGADEGAAVGEALTWKLDGVPVLTPAAGSDTAQDETTNNDYTISAVINPTLTATIQNSGEAITLDETLDLSILLNNTAAGSANTTLVSVNDTNLTTDLPKTIVVGKNTTNQTATTISSPVCGLHTSAMTIESYSLGGTLIETLTENFTLNISGADLVLGDVTLSDSTPEIGSSASATAIVTNNGTENVSSFTTYFYQDGNVFDTLTYNQVLEPNESIGVSANFLAEEGTHEINLTLSTPSTECHLTNNYKIIGYTGEEAGTTTSSSSGSSGSSGGGGGGIGITDCNDNRDNDGDGLIDYPGDPGCSSKNDDNETGTAQTVSPDSISEEKSNTSPSLEENAAESEDPEEKITGFVPAIKDIAGDFTEDKTNWLALIFIVLCFILVYNMVSKKKMTVTIEDSKQESFHRPFGDQLNKTRSQEFAVQKPVQKVAESAQEGTQIQKTIKISSKKEVIDKLKEVYNEDDSR